MSAFQRLPDDIARRSILMSLRERLMDVRNHGRRADHLMLIGYLGGLLAAHVIGLDAHRRLYELSRNAMEHAPEAPCPF